MPFGFTDTTSLLAEARTLKLVILQEKAIYGRGI
jgi:hypothetical protein